jgi:hypothetical protein
LGVCGRMAVGKVRGRAVGRSNISGSKARRLRSAVVSKFMRTTKRAALVVASATADICVWPVAAARPTRANLAPIQWRVNSTSEPDNLLHITDERGSSQHCYHQTLIRVKWRSAEPPRRAARASAVIRQAHSAIFASGSVHGRSRLASPARRQGDARSAPVMRAAIGLLVKQKCRILRHSRATWNADLEPKA